MKKLMLIMAAALVSLSACSKGADEPVAQQNQNDEVLTSIKLKIEGEREPIQVVEGEQAIDQQGRALNLTGTTRGNRITGITLGDTKSVEGVVYIYTPGSSTPGIARKVLFNVEGNKISYYGELDNVNLKKGDLKLSKMDVYVGGSIKRDDINNRTDARGGSVEYFASTVALRTPTEGTMDLSAFNPIFYSTNVPVTKSADGADRDYFSVNHRFKLYGEFISVRFRMKGQARHVTGTFNGFLVRGFGRNGVTLDAPDAGNKYKPTMRATPSANHRNGLWTPFSDKLKPTDTPYQISIQRGGVPYEGSLNNLRDAAYTLYLFTPAEEHGGFRLGLNKSPNIFSNQIGFQNYPGYWGGDGTNTYHSTSKNWGKFHNLFLVYEF